MLKMKRECQKTRREGIVKIATKFYEKLYDADSDENISTMEIGENNKDPFFTILEEEVKFILNRGQRQI